MSNIIYTPKIHEIKILPDTVRQQFKEAFDASGENLKAIQITFLKTNEMLVQTSGVGIGIQDNNRINITKMRQIREKYPEMINPSLLNLVMDIQDSSILQLVIDEIHWDLGFCGDTFHFDVSIMSRGTIILSHDDIVNAGIEAQYELEEILQEDSIDIDEMAFAGAQICTIVQEPQNSAHQRLNSWVYLQEDIKDWKLMNEKQIKVLEKQLGIHILSNKNAQS